MFPPAASGTAYSGNATIELGLLVGKMYSLRWITNSLPCGIFNASLPNRDCDDGLNEADCGCDHQRMRTAILTTVCLEKC